MADPNQFESLSKKLLDALPAHLKAFEEDIQQQFKMILTSAFEKMDIVTREEFDVQVKVLERTREKLDKLQQIIDTLKAQGKSREQLE